MKLSLFIGLCAISWGSSGAALVADAIPATGGLQEPFEIPSVSDIDVEIMISRRQRTASMQWKTVYLETLRALAVGDIADFHNLLEQVKQAPRTFDIATRLEQLCQLYSWALEAGVDVPLEDYGNAIDAVPPRWRDAENPHGAKLVLDINGSRWKRIRANYLYATSDSAGLKVLRAQRGMKNEADAVSAVDAHIAFLIAMLDQSRPAIDEAIAALKSVVHGAGAQATDRGTGRAALNLSRLYLLRARSADGHDQFTWLSAANTYANRARDRLELLDVPVLWARAMDHSSEVLNLLADHEDRSNPQGYRAQLRAGFKARRAKELSAELVPEVGR